MIYQIHGRTYQVPQAWNELTSAQLLGIMRISNDPTIDAIACLLKLLKLVTGMGWWRFFRCPPDVLHEHLPLLDFLFGKNTLTKNVLPVVPGGVFVPHNFYGPADNFGNLLMDEFVFSEEYFMGYRADEKNVGLLNNLVSVLYRPGKKGYDMRRNPDGDVRVPFNEHLSAYNAKYVISNWDLEVKQAIAHWYDACRLQMIADFPTVFGGEGGEAARWGLVSMMRNVAIGGVHGDFKDVEKQFVKMIMIELDEMIADAERIENQKPKTT